MTDRIVCLISFSVDCSWSTWSLSGSCSRSCGGGSERYTRSKIRRESNGGSCTGSNEKFQLCNTQDCPGESTYLTNIFTVDLRDWLSIYRVFKVQVNIFDPYPDQPSVDQNA